MLVPTVNGLPGHGALSVQRPTIYETLDHEALKRSRRAMRPCRRSYGRHGDGFSRVET